MQLWYRSIAKNLDFQGYNNIIIDGMSDIKDDALKFELAQQKLQELLFKDMFSLQTISNHIHISNDDTVIFPNKFK